MSMQALPARSEILDGESVVCDRGVTDFDALRSTMASGRAPDAFLYVFDLLELNGKDLRKLPWEERRTRLTQLLTKPRFGLVLSEHTDGDGEPLFRKACDMGLEGLVAKRRQSLYRGGPSKYWIKIKNPEAPAFSRVRDAIEAKVAKSCGV
jgi:bifunctional non-homologous end joining protein LigD